MTIYRVGIGYDVHRFIDGRKLMLGGVEIPYAKGLDGHSDADVVLHALCDALLGAMGHGDIGQHFPNTEKDFKDISSVILLEKVMTMLQTEGYKVNNVDIVVIAEEPNLKEYKNQMRFRIAYVLAMDEMAVNIKATTQETMGFIGRKEGIAAIANISLSKEQT